MSGFRPTPGAEFLLADQRYRVESYDNQRGCLVVANAHGELTTYAIDDLVHHPALTIPSQSAAPHTVASDLPEHCRNVAMRRIDHVCEAMTGFRSGDPNQALPGEPRAEYDPGQVLQKDRLATKARELDNEFAREFGVTMSERSMRRLWTQIRAGTALSAAGGRSAPRRSNGRRIHKAVKDATELLIADQRGETSKSVRGLYIDLKGRLLKQYNEDWIAQNLPSERTWRRYVNDRWTPSEISGKARTRASATVAPSGGFNRPNPTRPGQFLFMDTNSLDVLLKGTVLEGAIRGSVVFSMDWYSRSVCSLRVVEQAEKNIDVAFALLDVSRPKQMLPGWPSEARWPFVGIPESVLLRASGDDTRHSGGVAGMPIVNPEALVTDHGTTYKAHKTRELCRRFQIDLLPARSYTGSDKAVIERFFESMRTMLLERLSGYRGSDPSERGTDVDSNVEWTAQRLEDLLSLWVVLIWQTHTMDDVKPPWCPEGDWSPNDLYLHGIETSGLAPKIMTAADHLSVLSSRHVKVQSRGVKILGLWYDDDEVLGSRRSQRAPNATGKWTVYVDKRDLRQVWFIDEAGGRHPLPWAGATGDFPAFGERHVNALRNRLRGRLTDYSDDDLAEVLLTHVLPVRDAQGWVVNGERRDAVASKHARDLELAAKDAARYELPAQTATGGSLEAALERKRRDRRLAASVGTAIAPAAPMRATATSMFGGLAELVDGDGETA